MTFLSDNWMKIAVALGIGLLIGVERERRKGGGRDRAPAGIRTYAVTALLGALAFELGGIPLLAVVTLSVAGFIALGYFRTRSQRDPGLTSEFVQLLTLLLGALAMREPLLASGLGVTVALLLAARTRIHTFVRKTLTEAELHDALVLAGAALVVLPLLPDRYMGPLPCNQSAYFVGHRSVDDVDQRERVYRLAPVWSALWVAHGRAGLGVRIQFGDDSLHGHARQTEAGTHASSGRRCCSLNCSHHCADGCCTWRNPSRNTCRNGGATPIGGIDGDDLWSVVFREGAAAENT